VKVTAKFTGWANRKVLGETLSAPFFYAQFSMPCLERLDIDGEAEDGGAEPPVFLVYRVTHGVKSAASIDGGEG
jgi:hypothetical protein